MAQKITVKHEKIASPKAKSILLVDDDRFITVAYKEGLGHAGFQVLIARDGIEALEVLKSFTPSIILLDLIMPKMNGFEFLDKIKSDNKFNNIPIIVLTNLSQQSDEDEARAHNIANYLVKADTSLSALIESIQKSI